MSDGTGRLRLIAAPGGETREAEGPLAAALAAHRDLADGAEAVLIADPAALAAVDIARLWNFHRGHDEDASVVGLPGGARAWILSAAAFRAGADPAAARPWAYPAPSRRRPAVFLDRDGTLIDEIHYLADPALVRPIAGAAGALVRLAAAGYALVVVSNQSGVGRGLVTRDQLRAVDAEIVRQFAGQGAGFDGLYASTDAPAGEDAPIAWRGRRKPGPGMLCEAAAALDLDLSRSWMVGDMARDLLAGRNAGCRGLVLVRTGKGRSQEGEIAGLDARVADDLAAAADLILADRP